MAAQRSEIIKGHKVNMGVMDLLLWLMVSWIYMDVKTYKIVWFKYGQVIACHLYLIKT